MKYINIKIHSSWLRTSGENSFKIIKKIFSSVRKAPVYWYYTANLLALMYIVVSLYTSFSIEISLKNVNEEIANEKKLISQIDRLYNKNINEWSAITSPNSLEILAQKHLSDFEPIFQENSVNELPQNKEQR